jgi:uncharacterized protein (TIGR00369 family)
VVARHSRRQSVPRALPVEATHDEREALTVEFKINFLKPAKTERLVVVGQVLQSGRTLTVCEATVFDETRTRAIARMTTTMMSVASTTGA